MQMPALSSFSTFGGLAIAITLAYLGIQNFHYKETVKEHVNRIISAAGLRHAVESSHLYEENESWIILKILERLVDKDSKRWFNYLNLKTVLIINYTMLFTLAIFMMF